MAVARALRHPRARSGALRQDGVDRLDRRGGELRAAAHGREVVPHPRVAAEPRRGARPGALRARAPQRHGEHRARAQAHGRRRGGVLDRPAQRRHRAAGALVSRETRTDPDESVGAHSVRPRALKAPAVRPYRGKPKTRPVSTSVSPGWKRHVRTASMMAADCSGKALRRWTCFTLPSLPTITRTGMVL